MTWIIVKNPNGLEGPKPLRGACHDGSAFLTIRCSCGCPMHIHETQLAGAPKAATLETHCIDCKELIEMPVGMIREAINEAWIR